MRRAREPGRAPDRAGAPALDGPVRPVPVGLRDLDLSRVPVRATGPLPHHDAVQRAFGPHDLSTVRAQVGGAATGWNAFLGAAAFTRGEEVAFAAPPTLEDAAHEAAHVVQQRQGSRPPGGLSRAGDAGERAADAVARRVAGGANAADLLGPPAPPVRGPAPMQRRLVAHGSDADILRFFALAEPAAGLQLHRDPATDVVTSVASLAGAPTSPAFARFLTGLLDDPAQLAEARFGEHQSGTGPTGAPGAVIVGAFPNAAPTVQLIDLDDLEAVEAGAPGRGVAFLAHELQENATAHLLPVGPASLQPAHDVGNVVEEEVAADLVGPGTELLEYMVILPGDRGHFIEDYGGYFVVVDLEGVPAPPLTSTPPDVVVTGARHVAPTVLSTATVDAFPTGIDALPAAAAPAVAAAAALLAAHPTAAAHVEGFTDDVGTEAGNRALGRQRAGSGRAALLAAGAGLERRVAAIGRGATAFVSPNASDAERARNRRIVITVLRP